MKYTYNNKISRKANESLQRRARTVQFQKQVFALIGIIIVSILILLGSTISAFASAGKKEDLHKYYTSIQVESGDTLWDIAGEYTLDHTMSRESFIEEVSRLNGLSDGHIHSGSYIVIPYYSAEEQ